MKLNFLLLPLVLGWIALNSIVENATAQEDQSETLKIQSSLRDYAPSDTVSIRITNLSKNILMATVTLKEEIGGQWIEVLPYLGAKHYTKASKVERWQAGGTLEFTWNGSNTPSNYRRSHGTFKIIAEFFDAERQAYTSSIELGHFTISKDDKK